MKQFFLLFSFLIIHYFSFSANYTWTGVINNDWETSSNWSPASVPLPSDNIIIPASGIINMPVLNQDQAIADFSILSGTLDLNSYTLTVNGNGTYSGGSINNGNFIDLDGGTSTFNGTSFGAEVNASSTELSFSNTLFSSPTILTKTGSGTSTCSGNNTFNSTTEINNTGNGILTLGNVTADIFNGLVSFNNTGEGRMQIAHNSSNNIFASTCIFNNLTTAANSIRICEQAGSSATFMGTAEFNSLGSNSANYIRIANNGNCSFNGNIIVSSDTGAGIRFGSNNGNVILNAGYTISIGPAGFSEGILLLKNFSQFGNTDLSLALSNASTLTLGPLSVFNGNVIFTSPQLYLDGATFNGAAVLEKKGASNNTSYGGNIFNGTTLIKNSGSHYIRLAGTLGDTFNSDVSFINFSGSLIDPSYNGTNYYNGNIIISNKDSATGIKFGVAAGTSILAANKTISIGTSGFSSGTLELSGFIQTGPSSQNLTLTGNAVLELGAATSFDADVNFNSPQLKLNGATFNGNAILEKTGITNNNCDGGNVFNGITSITNSSTARLRLATLSGDNFNKNVTFNNTGAGALEPAYDYTNSFSGDITVNSLNPIVFGSNTGTVLLAGGNSQTIKKTGIASPIFKTLEINKSNNDVSLLTEISISSSLIFNSGTINSSSSNLLTFNNMAISAGCSDNSYTIGPVRKIGSQTFTFPVGKNGRYRPISISAPALISDHFTAEYFNDNPCDIYGSSRDLNLDHISQREYWKLDRSGGTSSVNVTLSWNSNSGGISNLSTLRIARWNGSQWRDHGNDGFPSGDVIAGTITSSSPVNSFSPFTLSSLDASNPLPITLLHFSAILMEEKVQIHWKTLQEINLDYYSIERSLDGKSFIELKTINPSMSSSDKDYIIYDENPASGNLYYRLKTIDYDGYYQFSATVSLNNYSEKNVKIFPSVFSDFIHLSLPEKNNSYSLKIIQVDGKQLFEKQFNGGFTSLNLSNYQPGLYFFEITYANEKVIKKIIKK